MISLLQPRVTAIGSFTVPAQSKRPTPPAILRGPQSDQEFIAYRLITAERNAENKKKLGKSTRPAAM